MVIRGISESTQKLIRSTQSVFTAAISIGSKTMEEHIFTFIREQVAEGIEKLLIKNLSSANAVIFGYYDRNQNTLSHSDLIGWEIIKDTLSFKIGYYSPSAEEKTRNAMKLVTPYLFTPDGSLNEEEMDQLPCNRSSIKVSEDHVLWFASQLHANPAASFQEIIFSDMIYTLWGDLAVCRQLVFPDQHVLLEAEQDAQRKVTMQLQLVRQILFDSSEEVTIALSSAWKSFVKAKKEIQKSPTKQVSIANYVIERAKKIEEKDNNYEVFSIYFCGGNLFCQSKISACLSPLGIHLRRGTGSSLYWNKVTRITHHKKILYQA